MMWKDYYKQYKKYPKQKIFDILKNKKEYQHSAVKAAELISKENQWESELALQIDKENQIREKEIFEKAEYYKNMY